jgi:hypothetical protein
LDGRLKLSLLSRSLQECAAYMMDFFGGTNKNCPQKLFSHRMGFLSGSQGGQIDMNMSIHAAFCAVVGGWRGRRIVTRKEMDRGI